MQCPRCGAEDVYVGLNEVECWNDECVLFKPHETRIKGRVYWQVGGAQGVSRWLPSKDAEGRAKRGNERYGAGTHYVEYDEIEGYLMP